MTSVSCVERLPPLTCCQTCVVFRRVCFSGRSRNKPPGYNESARIVFFPQSNCRTNDVYWWSPTGICNIETLEGATVMHVKSFRTTNRLCKEFDKKEKKEKKKKNRNPDSCSCYRCWSHSKLTWYNVHYIYLEPVCLCVCEREILRA